MSVLARPALRLGAGGLGLALVFAAAFGMGRLTGVFSGSAPPRSGRIVPSGHAVTPGGLSISDGGYTLRPNGTRLHDHGDPVFTFTITGPLHRSRRRLRQGHHRLLPHRRALGTHLVRPP